MGKNRSPIQLAKFLAYALGRRPDEFGLVPDENGWVRIKELIKAVCEEEGWRHVRRASINEVILTVPDAPVTVDDPLIRAADRSRLPEKAPALAPPKLLFTCIRRRAWPHVAQRGIYPSDDRPIVFAAEPEMARRIGRRSDADPVRLTVNVQQAAENGVVFYTAGEGLFVADFLPIGCFTGPPLPKEQPETGKPRAKPAEAVEKTPGSFPLKDLPTFGRKDKNGPKQRKKEIAWKKGRRQLKKMSRDG